MLFNEGELQENKLSSFCKFKWKLLNTTFRYQQSAQLYALTQVSFEEVALKFLQVRDSDALKVFLLKKMGSLKTTVSWLAQMLI